MKRFLLVAAILVVALPAAAQEIFVQVFDADKQLVASYQGEPMALKVVDRGMPVTLDLFAVHRKGAIPPGLALNLVQGSRSARFYTDDRFIEGQMEGSNLRVIVDRRPGAPK